MDGSEIPTHQEQAAVSENPKDFGFMKWNGLRDDADGWHPPHGPIHPRNASCVVTFAPGYAFLTGPAPKRQHWYRYNHVGAIPHGYTIICGVFSAT